ncbi:Ig-like domain-containing protein [Alloalcanivorax xenomutans]|uniref:Ig-like domain-containing protein n=1 Tax=Alloalcanivorax xenomutans TaxID=1094342 RepID=UPI003A80F114
MIRGTFNRTLYGTLLITACATVLTACGGSDGSSMPGNDANDAQRQSLLYAYPDDGQAEVPTKAPVVLRFTSDVSLGDVEQSVTLCCDAEGGNLDYTAETVGPDPRGVILTPAQSLSPLTDYTIAIKNLRLRNGTSADRTLRFTTRPLAEGPRSLVVKDDSFAIDRQMPNGDTNEPIMDFSSFRFQFTQPVDRASARYGDTVVLTDSSGETVEATLLINGHYMTVDPKPEYLTPGQSYTLSLTNGLTSTFDEAFAGTEINFTPADSSPRGEPAMLVQRITQSGLSRLTGKNINQVPVNGTLLGEDVNVTQASADAVVAELADVTEYPDVTPIRLPRGTKLTGSAIEMVMIGGEVPAGFGSGPVDMRLTSDATGYLVPNPYNVHNRADALRIVHLLMDVGIATEDPRANGGFTQDIMHIELVGVAEVDTEAGVLNLDAVGMVEPNILGQEYGHGLLSFQLQSYKDQMNAPTAPEDTTGPTLQSWTLGTDTITGEDKSLLAKPGDPIILNFDEPIDPQSVEGNVTLYKTVNGGTEEEMPAQVYVDGAAIVVKPEEDLQYSPEEAPVGYRLRIDTGITDVANNTLAMRFDEPFILQARVENSIEAITKAASTSTSPATLGSLNRRTEHSPIILASYPGFPCALEQEFLDALGTGDIDQTRDLENNKAGRCAGGHPGINGTIEVDQVPSDDIIPVMPMPSNRPIIISLSQAIEASSVVQGKTFSVEHYDSNLSDWVTVSGGTLRVSGKTITYLPETEWGDGELYRYTLASSGYAICPIRMVTHQNGKLIASSNGLDRCSGDPIIDNLIFECGTDAVCGTNGLPVQTQPIGTFTTTTYNADGSPTGKDKDYLEQPVGTSIDAGGVDFVQFFRGTIKDNNVLQLLTTEPYSDTNANFFSERTYKYNDLPISFFGYPSDLQFAKEETGPAGELLPGDPGYDSVDTQYDPSPLKPAPNSVKVLSRGQNQNLRSPFATILVSSDGMNIGCGYDYVYDEDGTPNPTQFDPNSMLACPESKFSYLMSAMMAEVTDTITEKGIQVKLWPSMVAGTSLDLFQLYYNTLAGVGAAIPVGHTGKQLLRMRYSGINRNEPVIAYIKNYGEGPVLEATLDLYLDVPFALPWGLDQDGGGNSVNMRSYPLSLSLAGPVHFLDDGRMSVEQWNLEEFDITINLYGGDATKFGYADFFVPAYGNRLNYVSQPIK